MNRRLSAAVLFFAFSCGPATNAQNKGPVLASVSGRMTASEGLALTQPVRMSIEWLPIGPPVYVASEEVVFTGSFPQDFSLDLHSLPPRSVLDASNGFGVQGAVGALLAYEDLDGNGELTRAHGAQAVPDRIVGSSLRHYVNLHAPLEAPYDYVLFLEKTPPESSGFFTGLAPGFYLVSIKFGTDADPRPTTKVMPLNEAHLTLQLVDDPLLNRFACDDFLAHLKDGTAWTQSWCGL